MLAEAIGVPEAAFGPVMPGLSSKVAQMREAGRWPPPLMELWPAWYAMLIEAVGVDADPVAVAGRMRDLFRDPASYVAFPEVPDMLARLAAGGHRVAILSNTDVDLWPILDAPRLGSFVEIAVAAFRHGVEKPSPRAFNLALGALGVEAAGTWFVGDDLRDDCVASDALGPTPAASPASTTSPPPRPAAIRRVAGVSRRRLRLDPPFRGHNPPFSSAYEGKRRPTSSTQRVDRNFRAPG